MSTCRSSAEIELLFSKTLPCWLFANVLILIVFPLVIRHIKHSQPWVRWNRIDLENSLGHSATCSANALLNENAMCGLFAGFCLCAASACKQGMHLKATRGACPRFEMAHLVVLPMGGQLFAFATAHVVSGKTMSVGWHASVEGAAGHNQNLRCRKSSLAS